MEYTVIFNGKSYDLPKKTMQIWEELDSIYKLDANKGISNRVKYEKMVQFVKKLVGADNTIEIYGTDNLEKMDLNDIVLSVRKIKDAYENPLRNYQNEVMRESFNQLPIDKLAPMTKLLDQAAKMSNSNK